MPAFYRTNSKIADILRWNKEGQLILQPKFQRRSVWENDARSYLVDTVVRNYPMPKIYLRKIPGRRTSEAYEVVDGQQRLKAILDFLNGELILSKRHNQELGDTTFDGLPEPRQRKFLQYAISTEVMEEATDPEVWGMFERLNSYTLTLNRQEKLHARWFGYFKQTCYKLAAEQSALDAWENMRVFSNRQVARMKEVELTSDVLVAIIRGISDITEIANAYRDFDKEFPKRDFAADTFRKSLSFIKSGFQETVQNTGFRKKTWFYSLLTATADALVGIAHGYGPRRFRPTEEVAQRMLSLNSRLAPTPIGLPQSLATLHESLSRRTSHIAERRIRHEYFYGMLTLTQPAWEEKLEQKR